MALCLIFRQYLHIPAPAEVHGVLKGLEEHGAEAIHYHPTERRFLLAVHNDHGAALPVAAAADAVVLIIAVIGSSHVHRGLISRGVDSNRSEFHRFFLSGVAKQVEVG